MTNSVPSSAPLGVVVQFDIYVPSARFDAFDAITAADYGHWVDIECSSFEEVRGLLGHHRGYRFHVRVVGSLPPVRRFLLALDRSDAPRKKFLLDAVTFSLPSTM